MVGIYVALWILTTLIWPITPANRDLDSLKGNKTLYRNSTREVVYSLPIRCNAAPKKRVIMLGSSAARSYRPKILQLMLKADEVDNLATERSNITQIHQVFDDLRFCLGDKALGSTKILLITTAFLYGDDSRWWPGGYTEYEKEKIRHGLYSGHPKALAPTFGQGSMPWAIDLFRPVFAFYNLRFDGVSLLYKAELAFNRLYNGPQKVDQGRALLLKYLRATVPDQTDGAEFGAEQFRELDTLVSEINASGASLVLVNEPVDTWLRQATPSFESYRKRMASFAGKRGIPLIDLSTSARESEFVDPVDGLHPSDDKMALWTRRLAEQLRLAGTSPSRPVVIDSKAVRLLKNKALD